MLIQRKNLFTIVLALVLGVFIGWLVKPTGHQQHENEVHDHGDHANETWTCSMHPQIRQDEPGKCPICGMDLIPVASKRNGSETNLLVHEMTPEAVAMANVQTSRVRAMSSEGELNLTGKIKADERLLASITAKYPGRIEKLHVSFTGQYVNAGEKLATLYSPELLTAQKELLEAARSKEAFPELYASAREKLRLWKLSEDQIRDIEQSGNIRDEFDVLADKGGIVTQRNVTIGDYVSTGTVLFNVADLSRVWVMIDAYETDLSQLKAGNEVNFQVAAVPGKIFKAKVTYIDPVINPATRTASVRAETANANRELKPEMFVHARVLTVPSAHDQKISVPRTALLWSGKRSVVYVKVPGTEYPSYEMREVVIGPKMGDMYLIEEGLDPEEEIVTNGVFAIDAAAQLSGNYSMMMRPEIKTLEVPQAFREQVSEVAEAYFTMKNALVEADPHKAREASKSMLNAIGKVEMASLDHSAHDRWMMLASAMSDALELLGNTDHLEEQREYFSTVSDNILEVAETFGLLRDKVYRHYCPMAFDNQGAFWLSEFEEIRNPYFGDAMLTCGEVKATYEEGKPVYGKGSPPSPQPAGGHNH